MEENDNELVTKFRNLINKNKPLNDQDIHHPDENLPEIVTPSTLQKQENEDTPLASNNEPPRGRSSVFHLLQKFDKKAVLGNNQEQEKEDKSKSKERGSVMMTGERGSVLHRFRMAQQNEEKSNSPNKPPIIDQARKSQEPGNQNFKNILKRFDQSLKQETQTEKTEETTLENRAADPQISAPVIVPVDEVISQEIAPVNENNIINDEEQKPRQSNLLKKIRRINNKSTEPKQEKENLELKEKSSSKIESLPKVEIEAKSKGAQSFASTSKPADLVITHRPSVIDLVKMNEQRVKESSLKRKLSSPKIETKDAEEEDKPEEINLLPENSFEEEPEKEENNKVLKSYRHTTAETFSDNIKEIKNFLKMLRDEKNEDQINDLQRHNSERHSASQKLTNINDNDLQNVKELIDYYEHKVELKKRSNSMSWRPRTRNTVTVTKGYRKNKLKVSTIREEEDEISKMEAESAREEKKSKSSSSLPNLSEGENFNNELHSEGNKNEDLVINEDPQLLCNEEDRMEFNTFEENTCKKEPSNHNQNECEDEIKEKLEIKSQSISDHDCKVIEEPLKKEHNHSDIECVETINRNQQLNEEKLNIDKQLRDLMGDHESSKNAEAVRDNSCDMKQEECSHEKKMDSCFKDEGNAEIEDEKREDVSDLECKSQKPHLEEMHPEDIKEDKDMEFHELPANPDDHQAERIPDKVENMEPIDVIVECPTLENRVSDNFSIACESSSAVVIEAKIEKKSKKDIVNSTVQVVLVNNFAFYPPEKPKENPEETAYFEISNSHSVIVSKQDDSVNISRNKPNPAKSTFKAEEPSIYETPFCSDHDLEDKHNIVANSQKPAGLAQANTALRKIQSYELNIGDLLPNERMAGKEMRSPKNDYNFKENDENYNSNPSLDDGKYQKNIINSLDNICISQYNISPNLPLDPLFFDVLCINCYECVKCEEVDLHSEFCVVRPDEDYELARKEGGEEDVNAKIYKLYQSIKRSEEEVKKANDPEVLIIFENLLELVYDIFLNNNSIEELDSDISKLNLLMNSKLKNINSIQKFSLMIFAKRVSQLVYLKLKDIEQALIIAKNNFEKEDINESVLSESDEEEEEEKFQNLKNELVSLERQTMKSKMELEAWRKEAKNLEKMLRKPVNNAEALSDIVSDVVSYKDDEYDQMTNITGQTDNEQDVGNMREINEVLAIKTEEDMKKYFFSIGLNIKFKYADKLKESFSIESLFEKAKKNCVPIHEWQKFIQKELKLV